MQHLTEAQLLDLIGGHSGSDERAAAEDHLAACESCRRLNQQLVNTWEVLGQWETIRPGRDISERIVIAAGSRGMRCPSAWRRFALVALKTAASIVLAAAIGYAAGRSYRSEPSAAARNLKQQAAASLYLDTFESGTPAGLSEYVLAATKESGEKEQ